MESLRLSVLVTDSSRESRTIVAAIAGLGHNVRAEKLDPQTAIRALRGADIEMIVVPRGESGGFALRLIGSLAHEGAYPVITAMPEMESEWLEEAVTAGAFGAVVGLDPDNFRISLRVAWQRHVDYRSLQEAFARRATIEQAKGLLMARYSIPSDDAFELLRDHSQRTNRKLLDVASALLNAHPILSDAGSQTTDERSRRQGRRARSDSAETRPA
jgi:hypothetical protein